MAVAVEEKNCFGVEAKLEQQKPLDVTSHKFLFEVRLQMETYALMTQKWLDLAGVRLTWRMSTHLCYWQNNESKCNIILGVSSRQTSSPMYKGRRYFHRPQKMNFKLLLPNTFSTVWKTCKGSVLHLKSFKVLWE